MILSGITTQELYQAIGEMVKEAVTSAMAKQFDRPMSSRDVANHFGVTIQTVNRWAKQGRIVRINKAGRPMYSFNQITKP